MRSPGRKKGQRGTLIKRGKVPTWIGRWYVHHGKQKSRQSVFLGYCEEMNETEARQRMLELIRQTNLESHALASIGRSSTVPQLAHVGTLTFAKSGSISELLVCADLMAKGWDVYRAMDATCACDLMCVKAGFTARIEVKTGNRDKGRLLGLETKAGKFDILALVEGANLFYYAYHQLGDLKRPNLSDPRGNVASFSPLADHDSDFIGDLQ